MTTNSTLPSPGVSSIQLTNAGTLHTTNGTTWSQVTSTGHSHTLYSGGGISGAHGPQIPAFIPIFDPKIGTYMNVPYWEFHKVYEEHKKLLALAEEFPAVKQALDSLNTVVKLHRED